MVVRLKKGGLRGSSAEKKVKPNRPKYRSIKALLDLNAGLLTRPASTRTTQGQTVLKLLWAKRKYW